MGVSPCREGAGGGCGGRAVPGAAGRVFKEPGGAYQGFFEWQFGDRAEYRAEILPLVEALVSRREPPPLVVLAVVAGTDEATLRQRLARLGSDDDTLKVWDLATGRKLATLAGHSHFVSAYVVTPDGRHLAAGDEAGHVCFLEIRG